MNKIYAWKWAVLAWIQINHGLLSSWIPGVTHHVGFFLKFLSLSENIWWCIFCHRIGRGIHRTASPSDSGACQELSVLQPVISSPSTSLGKLFWDFFIDGSLAGPALLPNTFLTSPSLSARKLAYMEKTMDGGSINEKPWGSSSGLCDGGMHSQVQRGMPFFLARVIFSFSLFRGW